MHSLGTVSFEALGLYRPRTAKEVGLGDFARWEDSYRKRKLRPEPMMEFMIRWVHTNTPPKPSGIAFIASDPGQFIYDNGRVNAILDLEIAYIGDPAADFAGMRHRDMGEPLGDMKRALERYTQISGRHVDPKVVDYHTVRFGIYTSLCSAHILAAPTPDIDLMQYSAWHLTGSRVSLDTILRLRGLPLEPMTFPQPTPTRQSVDHLALVGILETIHASDEFNSYRLDSATRVARYLARAEDLGPAIWAEDFEEMATILGRRPSNWEEGNAELEQLVLTAGPEREIELAQYFRRNLLRQEWLLRGQIPELDDAYLPPIG